MWIALFYLFLINIPFGYRKILYQWTPGFDEYETAFFYANDITLLLLVGFFLFSNFSLKEHAHLFKSSNKLHKASSIKILFFFIVICGISIFSATLPFLSLYNFVRLLFLCITSFVVSRAITSDKSNFVLSIGSIASLAVFEAIIGYFQFVLQKSLGFWWLGESWLGQFVPGSAKIIIEGIQILRAYGTFPHPNILGAFLVLGLASIYYFWLKRPSEWKIWAGLKTLKSDLFLGTGIFIILLGIVLTFSRSAWIVSLILTFSIIFITFFTKHWIQAVRLAILFAFTSVILLVTCWPFIFPRSQISKKDPAVSYRLSYNRVGIDLIKNNPLGVGLGNQVIYSVDNRVYHNAGMVNVWEWQPIHNIYILIAVEIGIFGLLVFLIFIVKILAQGIFPMKSFRLNFNLENYTTKIMLLSLLALGMVDHYFWTLEPGRLMLWLVIGMVMGVGELSSEKMNAPKN